MHRISLLTGLRGGKEESGISGKGKGVIKIRGGESKPSTAANGGKEKKKNRG